MSYRYTIVGTTLDDKVFGNFANVAIANVFRNLGKHFEGVAVGSISEAVTLNSGPTKGTGTISIDTGNMSDADTITINSVVLTAKTTPTTASQFKIGSSALLTAINLTALINSYSALNTIVRASYAKGTVTTTGVVTVTALNNGTAGNYTWSQSGSNVTLLPASAMGSGTNGPTPAANVFTITSSNLSANDTVTIGNVVFTAETSGAVGNQFNVGASALITAQNLAAAINAYSATGNVFTAVATAGAASAGVVTVTVNYPGTIGNVIALTKSATNGSWTGGHTAAFYGGTDALVQTFHKGV